MALPHEIDYVCSWCGDVYRGPHAGTQVDNPSQVNDIGGNRNVSHGVCADCYTEQIETYRAGTRRALIDRQKAEFRELRRKQVPGEPTG